MDFSTLSPCQGWPALGEDTACSPVPILPRSRFNAALAALLQKERMQHPERDHTQIAKHNALNRVRRMTEAQGFVSGNGQIFSVFRQFAARLNWPDALWMPLTPTFLSTVTISLVNIAPPGGIIGNLNDEVPNQPS